jgi:L-fuculose-phosphate aldolase
MILDRFQSVGRDLFATGLVSSNTGNLSVRMGDRLIITRRGCNLGSIQEHDLIETGTFHNDRNTPLASVELAVHRAIYRETPAAAIVHAHPSYAVALSLTDTVIAAALKEHRIVMIHGHGSFAIGQLLEEAHNFTTMLEESCRVICLLRSLQAGMPKK